MADPATILVVDDEALLVRLIARLLEKAGHTVLTASDADEAVQVFQEARGSIGGLVVDLSIPPEGAEKLALTLLETSPGLGIVLMSGAPPDRSLENLLSNHGGDYVPKPFAPEALLAAVTRSLSR